MFDFENDMRGSVTQLIGIAYLAFTLVLFTAEQGQLDLAVIVDITFAPLSWVAFAFIAIPYYRRRRR